MSAPALLITQCLQNDFVQPIGRFDPVPNKLHVGHSEARRLLGEDPAHGPVARLMSWAHAQPREVLAIVHIRDWHDPDDAAQRTHLEAFGRHCVRGSEGARFAFPETDANRATVVDSIALNDFVGTTLANTLAPFAGRPMRVGVVGVWTEAKVGFLAYELVTRYPNFEVAVCSALCASSSRQQHFAALDHLRRILGVRVIDSLGEFFDFLGSGQPSEAPANTQFPVLSGAGATLRSDDAELARYLFRDCRQLDLKLLGGGFSGNVVAATKSIDMDGREQVPHVLKIGPRAAMGRERASFERVQEVMGNNAPAITDFADFGERGAIKYRYASMGGAGVATLQKQFEQGLAVDELRRVFDTVFVEQLGRFYRAAQLESDDLLTHYGFAAKWAPNVRARVEEILGHAATAASLAIAPGLATPNPCSFYEQTLAHLPARPRDEFYQAWVHGDLNGANIVRDGRGNVWLIDFFHARRAHVLLDLIKLENDLLYIWTKLDDQGDLLQACALFDRLMQVQDLAAPLPDLPASAGLAAKFTRTWQAVQILRGYYRDLVRSDRDPFQLWLGQLRYAAHTLSFEECSPLQKRWALYATGQLTARVTAALVRSTKLRLDFVATQFTAPGRLGLTLLPGRKDRGRELADDIATLREHGVSHVLCMVPSDELAHYGVADLIDTYRAAGIEVHHLPIPDQKACDVATMRVAVDFLDRALRAGATVMAHCVGGLGRTGMAAACLLRKHGLSAEAALAEVRRVRSPRAVETSEQEALVRQFVQ